MKLFNQHQIFSSPKEYTHCKQYHNHNPKVPQYPQGLLKGSFPLVIAVVGSYRRLPLGPLRILGKVLYTYLLIYYYPYTQWILRDLYTTSSIDHPLSPPAEDFSEDLHGIPGVQSITSISRTDDIYPLI